MKLKFLLFLANFQFRAESKKGHELSRAKLKSSSSSYGSSQLGLDSSLKHRFNKALSVDTNYWASVKLS